MAKAFHHVYIRLPADLGEWLEEKAKQHSSKTGYIRELLEKARAEEAGLVRCRLCREELHIDRAEQGGHGDYYCPPCFREATTEGEGM